MHDKKNQNKENQDQKLQHQEESGSQKIGCNVTNCAHNNIDDCTCKLDQIRVSPCRLHGDKTPEDETACASYYYVGDLNVEEKKSSLNT